MNTYDYYITDEDYDRAKENGIKPNTLEKRIRWYGWSKDKAISSPTQRRTCRRYYSTMAKNNGIKYQTFMNRISKLGWSMERAASEPTKNNGRASA